MKKTRLEAAVALFLCLAIRSIASPGQANPQKSSLLEVGSLAPEFKIEKWLKGGGFERLEKGKVYVIDIWATWCVPCIAGMPHLSRLQQAYKAKGVEIIGITSEDTYGNSLAKVEEFVKKKDSIMGYNIAWVPPSTNKDGLKGVFVHPWMQMIGSMNIPTAFIVDRNGFIAYIGDPHAIDDVLSEIADNKYDLDLARKKYREGLAAQELLQKLDGALKKNEIENAVSLGGQILKNFSYVRSVTYLGLASSITEMKGSIDPRLLDIALTAAKRGVILTQFESPGYFDALATVYAAMGDYVMAAASEKLAVGCSEGEMRENQLKKFNSYKALVK